MDADYVERYDRQIRLWGQHGQSKFSSAKVCLVYANALGTEILKGLCLAGVGGFTILDSNRVTPDDVGSNFFLPSAMYGKSRAEAAKQSLLELGENIVAHVASFEEYLPHPSPRQKDDPQSEESENCDFWRQFNVVVVSGFLYVDQISNLSQICWKLNIPLIYTKSTGFFAYSQTQVKEHAIMESHPDNVLTDFCLDSPFPELRAYLDSVDLEKCDVYAQSNYPYLVILYKYLKQWQSQKQLPSTRLPENFSEKKELKNLINEAQSKLKESCDDKNYEFENFAEASKAVNFSLTYSKKLPQSVLNLFADFKIDDSSSVRSLSAFWTIIKSIRDFAFCKNNGVLPTIGLLPDMHSASEEYTRLQKIFLTKAKLDVDAVFDIVHSYQDSSLSPNNLLAKHLYEDTKILCENIRTVSIVRSPPIFEEWENKATKFKNREEEYQDDFLAIYLGLKAVDLFYSTYGRVPGCQDDQIEPDLVKLKLCSKSILGKSVSSIKCLDQCLYELCRCGGIELHATSAFVGGFVAQEIIKLITNQYQPVHGTLVYNSITASTKCFAPNEVFLFEKLHN